MKKYLRVLCLLSLIITIALVYSMQNNSQQKTVKSEYIDTICEAVKTMDFTVKEPKMDITAEEDMLYKEAYLKILKNQISISKEHNFSGYYQDLKNAGIPFEELLAKKSVNEFPYLLYYDDLDGDGKPELGINQGYMYILDYELGDKEFNVLYSRDSKVFEKIFGSGQIWCHYKIWDDTITIDEYDLLNRGTYWDRTVLELQQRTEQLQNRYFVETSLYRQFEISEESWKEITKPFFKAAKHEIPQKTLEEVFGELLKDS